MYCYRSQYLWWDSFIHVYVCRSRVLANGRTNYYIGCTKSFRQFNSRTLSRCFRSNAMAGYILKQYFITINSGARLQTILYASVFMLQGDQHRYRTHVYSERDMNSRTRVEHNLNCTACSQSGKWQVTLARLRPHADLIVRMRIPPRFSARCQVCSLCWEVNLLLSSFLISQLCVNLCICMLKGART